MGHRLRLELSFKLGLELRFKLRLKLRFKLGLRLKLERGPPNSIGLEAKSPHNSQPRWL